MENTTKKAIREAIKHGDLKRCRDIIDANPDAIQMSTVFGSLLHIAAFHGQLPIVQELIKRGIDVNTCGGVTGGNALNDAASQGHYEVVRYLLDSGSKMDVSEPERNPLFSAIYGGHDAVGELLVDRGIDTKIRYSGESMRNMDALAFAKERGATKFVEYLESLG